MGLFLIIGFLGGLIGGMGMGGGTLLIPMLTWFLGVEQKSAQMLNLLSFVIMAVFVVFVHIKNKLVDVKSGLICAFSGVVVSIIFSILVNKIDNNILKILFGVFLIVLSVIQMIFLFKNKNQKQKNARL